MKIEENMNLDELLSLMGKTVFSGGERFPTLDHATHLRELLVRDFADKDTTEIDGATWDLYCCTVDPVENEALGEIEALARSLEPQIWVIDPPDIPAALARLASMERAAATRQ